MTGSVLATRLSRRQPTPDHAAILADCQSNILTGHVRTHLVVLGIRCSSAARLRTVVGGLVPMIKTARQHLEEVAAFRVDGTPGTAFVNLALSAAGLGLLGAAGPDDEAFRSGMKHRPSAALGDPPVGAWEPAYQEDLHALVVVGGADAESVSVTLRSIRRFVSRHDVVLLERGRELRRSFGGRSSAVEHFGFVDGISQPIFIEEDLPTGPGWRPSATLEQVLVPEPSSAGAPRTYGSYLVLRKLQQDTAAFARNEHLVATALGLAGPDRAAAGARLIGRHRDGTPLATNGSPLGGAAVDDRFDHDGDVAGDRCPVFAHTRKMNPRGSSDGPADEHRRSMARRGQTYGRRRIADDGTFADRPSAGVGLLFLAFVASVTDQFEFVLSTWAENAGFPVLANPDGAIDPLIGPSPPAPIRLPTVWGAPGRTVVGPLEPVVRMLGGEYLFAPSLPFLARL